jgi:hypothetical protein
MPGNGESQTQTSPLPDREDAGVHEVSRHDSHNSSDDPSPLSRAADAYRQHSTAGPALTRSLEASPLLGARVTAFA